MRQGGRDESRQSSDFGESRARADTSRRRLTIHWFRNDLRLHDNPALCRTVELSRRDGEESTLLLVYIFDTSRIYGSEIKSAVSGEIKCGACRAKFMLEAVDDLRLNLEERLGVRLLVATGRPEDALLELVKQNLQPGGDQADQDTSVDLNLVCQREICHEELEVDKAVKTSLEGFIRDGGGGDGSRFNFEKIWGSLLYEPCDLPFEGGIDGIPTTFNKFRREVEAMCEVPRPLEAPTQERLGSLSTASVTRGYSYSATSVPTLSDLGYTDEQVECTRTVHPNSSLPKGYRGGESFALHRVKEWIWDRDMLQTYFDTRNGLIGEDYSTKFSPWLACGCLSPRYVALECRRYEEARVANKSTYCEFIRCAGLISLSCARTVSNLQTESQVRDFVVAHSLFLMYQYMTFETQTWNEMLKTNRVRLRAASEGLFQVLCREARATNLLSSWHSWQSGRRRTQMEENTRAY